MSVKLRVGIIGGGASGIFTAKYLLEAGHDVIVFEKTGNVGGVWNYSETGSSVMFKSLRTNLPTSVTQLKGFPFPEEVPSYPSHVDVLKYLENYSKHYKVDDVVRLDSTVTSLSKVGGRWVIRVTSGVKGDYEETFDRVVICNGHNSTPSMATIKGIEHFKGVVSHSRSYRTPEPYKGKRVVVIGQGPSGQEISFEMADNGALEVIVAASDYDPSAKDSQDRRLLKPVIERIAEDGSVVFKDGSSIASPDEIMHCTGYLYTANKLVPSELLFPKAFVQSDAVDKELAADLLAYAANGNVVAPLYKQVFAIEDPTAAFVGLPVRSPTFTCFELQARWITRVFNNSGVLPSKDDMYEEFYAYLRTLKEGPKKIHLLGGVRQKAYFNELADLADTVLGEEYHEMCDDADYLRVNFPHNYRSAEFRQDPATGKWIRRFKPSDSSPELVKEFSA